MSRVPDLHDRRTRIVVMNISYLLSFTLHKLDILNEHTIQLALTASFDIGYLLTCLLIINRGFVVLTSLKHLIVCIAITLKHWTEHKV